MEKKVALNQILYALNLPLVPGEVYFRGLCQDTRLCHLEDLLIVRPGDRWSAEDILQKAFLIPVKGLVTECLTVPEIEGKVFICVPDIEKALAPLYGLFYPELPRHLVGVTGTDGKTSVSHFLTQLWEMAQTPCCTIGTLGVHSHPQLDTSFSFPGMTTPSGTMLHQILNACASNQIDHAVFEISSHALAQSRIIPLQVSTSIFTNFSQDHLDYHKTIEAYWQAKCLLLSAHTRSHAVLFNHLPHDILAHICKEKGIAPLFFGPHDSHAKGYKNATYTILGREKLGQRVRFSIPGFEWESFIPLIGEFQIQNLLAALCAFSLEGGNLGTILPLLEKIKPILGRMEYVGSYNGGAIYVDYAHTPEALQKALLTLRPYAQGRVGLVFGCGGDRDQSKRVLMGGVAEASSDWTIITDDNPRYEDPQAIRDEITRGCATAIQVASRKEAIVQALSRLGQGDILLVAGKGHETVQIIRDEKKPFSDQAVIRSYIVGK